MHAFLDAMKRCDWVFTLHAIKPLFPHFQIYICVVKLETCPMRAITAAMDLARVVTRQCEYIIKIYSVLIFPLIALLHRSLARSLCERTFMPIMNVQPTRSRFSFGIFIGHNPKRSSWQKNTKQLTIWMCKPLLLGRNWKTSEHFKGMFNLTPCLHQLRWPIKLLFESRDGYNSFALQSICSSDANAYVNVMTLVSPKYFKWK